MKRTQGFTLIELMIAVVIVGILVKIAYPSYQKFVIKGNRSAAQQSLLQVANLEEQYMLDNRLYLVIANNAGFSALNYTVPSSVTRLYDLSVAVSNVATPPTYTITATPVSGTAQASDGSLTLTNTGVKTLNGATGW